MHSVEEPLPELVVPPLDELISGRPDCCFGMHVEWGNHPDPVPVFIRRFDASATGRGDSLYLFGARYETHGALFDGEPLGDGHIVEYFAIGESSGSWDCRRLLQQADDAYTEADSPIGHMPAARVDSPSLSLDGPPRWVSRAAAVWPTYADEPMLFVGQVQLPENEVTRTLLTWNVVLYVFRSHIGGRDVALVEQPVSEQSAEEHYAVEDELA